MPAHDLFGQAELPADLAHLVLEELAQWLDQLPWEIGSEAPPVVMRLDGDRGPAERRRGLDHIGIQRPLHQESDLSLDVLGRLLEHIDERVADATPLLFRVRDPGQRLKEERARIHHAQIDPEVRPERPLHLLPLAQPQQAMIHEDARQPVADRAVHERRGHRRIDSTREPADRPLG